MGCCGGEKKGPLPVRPATVAPSRVPAMPLPLAPVAPAGQGPASLPRCRWRGGETIPGRVECTSPKWMTGGLGVTHDGCRRCQFANHGHTGELLRLVPPPADLGVGPVSPTRPNV